MKIHTHLQSQLVCDIWNRQGPKILWYRFTKYGFWLYLNSLRIKMKLFLWFFLRTHAAMALLLSSNFESSRLKIRKKIDLYRPCIFSLYLINLPFLFLCKDKMTKTTYRWRHLFCVYHIRGLEFMTITWEASHQTGRHGAGAVAQKVSILRAKS